MTDPKDGVHGIQPRDLVQLLTEHLAEVTRLRSVRDDLQRFEQDIEKREEFLKNEIGSLRRDVESLKVERDSLAKANIQIAAAIGVVPSNVWVIPGKTFQPTTVAERVQRLAEAYKSTEAALKGVQAMAGQLSEPERAKHRAELEEVKCLAMSGRKHHQEFRRKIANQVRQLVGLARMASIVEAVDKTTIAMRLLAICREYEAGPY